MPTAKKLAKKTAKKSAARRPAPKRAVLITTAHRGVFFGYATDTTGETIALTGARLCLYWGADVKGFMGLASTGPTASCRVGPPADIALRNITSVVEVTPGAATAWEGAPWSR